VPSAAELLLEPDFLRRLERLSLVSRRLVRSGVRGERRSVTLGRGVEFADYRSYQVGDDYRYIDWNIYSRLDRLFVKLFSEEEDINVHLLVDRSRSMGFPRGTGAPSADGRAVAGTTAPVPAKLDYAVRVAAALGYIGLVNLDRVGVAAFDSRIGPVLAPGRGRSHVFHLFRFLGRLAPEGPSDLAAAMREYVHRTRRRGLAVLLSDLLLPEGLEEGLRLLRYHQFDLFVVHIVSDEDLAPPETGELRLVDSETGRAVEVTVDGPTLAAYARARDRYLAEVEACCRRHQIEYLRATTSVPFDDLILRYLRMGGLIA
jgi:uncharacterized protein (DUF58 family)